MLTLKNGTNITLGGLTAWDSIEIEKEIGKPISQIGEAGMEGVLQIAFRMARNGGYDQDFKTFAQAVDLQTDLPALSEAVASFFEGETGKG